MKSWNHCFLRLHISSNKWTSVIKSHFIYCGLKLMSSASWMHLICQLHSSKSVVTMPSKSILDHIFINCHVQRLWILDREASRYWTTAAVLLLHNFCAPTIFLWHNMQVESLRYLVNALVFLPPAVQGVKLWVTYNVTNLLKTEKKQIT